MSPSAVGSQPNLLCNDRTDLRSSYEHTFSPPNPRRLALHPLQHPSYSNHPTAKPNFTKTSPNHQPQRPVVVPPATSLQEPNRRKTVQPQYFDTNEFILRASNGQYFNNMPSPQRTTARPTRDYRPHSIDMNHHTNTMLDVYY